MSYILLRGEHSCVVYVDKRQHVDALHDDVRRPPPIFETHDYHDAVAYRESVYHEVIKGPGADWTPIIFPVANPMFRSLMEDNGQALRQGECAVNCDELCRAVDDNEHKIVESQCYGIRHEFAALVSCVFRDEIRARLAYIDEFMMWNNRLPVEEKPTSPSAYPWLGPNIEFDCWLFQQGIVRQWEASPDKSNNKAFIPGCDLFVGMYGLGRRDLDFLLGNSKADEREEQINTIERFHSLRGVLGRRPTTDIRAQLSFCSYAIRNSRASYGKSRFSPAVKSHQELAEDRRREFKIAKVLVDKVWDNLNTSEVRTLPKQIRHATDGDWYKLSPDEQKQLLGNEEELIHRFVYRGSKGAYRS